MTNFEQPTVLLAEDDPNDLIFFKRAICKANLTISLQVVENGVEAVEYLMGEGDYADRESYPLPKLIITDITMPLMNGFELLAWIKQQPDLQYIPVAVMSNSEEAAKRNQATALGASTYLLKSISFDALVENVGVVLKVITTV